jgi:hypothetical protein
MLELGIRSQARLKFSHNVKGF